MSVPSRTLAESAKVSSGVVIVGPLGDCAQVDFGEEAPEMLRGSILSGFDPEIVDFSRVEDQVVEI